VREVLRVLPRQSRTWPKQCASSRSMGGESAARLVTGMTAATTRVEDSALRLGDAKAAAELLPYVLETRAAVVVDHTILVIAYHLLSRDDTYRDPGEHDFDERDRHAVEHRLVSRLEGLGYKVTLNPAA
jgi:hypothetical protein